jgi:hypothetical protein
VRTYAEGGVISTVSRSSPSLCLRDDLMADSGLNMDSSDKMGWDRTGLF